MEILYTVDFSIPTNIVTGLNNGSLERIGGIIRETQSKHIVSWLKESGSPTDTLSCLPNSSALLHSTLGTSQLLNLSLTAVTIAAMEYYASRINDEIKKLRQQIDMQFDTERISKLQTALSTATNNSGDYQLRMMRISRAASDLQECYQSFTILATAQLDNAPTVAQQYLQYALTAIVANIRCNLELDDMKSAKNNLAEAIAYNNTFVPDLIDRLLGEHPAIYLNQDTASREDVARMLRVQQWRLRHTAQTTGEQSGPPISEFDEIITILDELRGDFWDKSVLPKNQPNFNRINNIIRKRQPDPGIEEAPLPAHKEALQYAEVTIENFQRLQGMDYELRLMRLSSRSSAANRLADPAKEPLSPFATWQGDLARANPENYPLAVFIPDEPITQAQLADV